MNSQVFLSQNYRINKQYLVIYSNIQQYIVMQRKDQVKKRYLSQFQEILMMRGVSFRDLTFFLGGYVFREINLSLDQNTYLQFEKCLDTLKENVDTFLITKKNFAEILIEALIQTQKLGHKPSLIKDFISTINANINQIALNPEYLIKKWSDEAKGENLYQQLLKKDELKRMEQEIQQQRLLKAFLEEQSKDLRKREQIQNKKTECMVCLQQIDYIDMVTIECSHCFHRHCLAEHIKSGVSEKKVDIACPAGCGAMLSVDLIYECMDGITQEKYEKFSLDVFVQKHQKDTSWCPTPGCTAIFSYEGGLDNYRCPVCHKHYCLACRCNYHHGMTCAEYRVNSRYSQDDKKFEDFARGAKFKQCPRCKYWVERAAGCSTMTCRCGHQFCYDCGGSNCPHGNCKKKGLIR